MERRGRMERTWQQSDWVVENRQRKESTMAGVVNSKAAGGLKVP